MVLKNIKKLKKKIEKGISYKSDTQEEDDLKK